MTQIVGEPFSDRHARETAAVVGRSRGLSRESIRRAKVIAARAPHLLREMSTADISIDAAYREATNDQTRPLYVRLDQRLDDLLMEEAARLGWSRQRVVRELLCDYLTGSSS